MRSSHSEAFSSWSWVFGHGLIMGGVVARGAVKFLVDEVIVRPAFDGHRVKKPPSALAMAAGRSSGKKCPPSIGSPVTLVASSRHNARGPPSSSYQADNGPDALQRASTGQEMRRLAARS